MAHDLDGLTLRCLDRQVLPGLPAHGDLLGCADRCPGQVEGDGAQGTRALYGGDRPIDGLVARGVADRGAERGDRLLCRFGADGGCRQRDDDAENRQRGQPAGAAVTQGGNRQGQSDDEEAHAAADDDDARDRLLPGFCCDEGDDGTLVDHVNAGEDGSRHEDQQAGDRHVDTRGNGAGAVGRHRGRGPSTRLGRARWRRPARVGLGGASVCRARPGLRVSLRAGGRFPVGGEAVGALLSAHGVPLHVSGRGGRPKRGGRSRSSRSARGAVLRCRAGGLVLSGLVRARDDEGDEADDEGGNYEEAEPASTETDANTAEDADGGQDGGHADKAQEETSQEGNVEASFCGFLRVDAPVLSLGQEEPRQAVGERHEGQAQGCDDGEDSHERQVPSAACSDA